MILKFGNHQGRKYWSIERVGYAGQVILEIPDYGNELTIYDTTGGSAELSMANYGVSADAMTLNIDDNYDGNADIRLEVGTQKDSQTYDAYLSNTDTTEGANVILMTTTD